MGRLLVFLLILICLSSTINGDWAIESKRVEFLIQQVGKVEGVFVRNGKEHFPNEAEEHLRFKLNRAMKSWFAPAKEEWTAEMFIEKVASKSSISGKAYLIKLNSGKTVNASDWLRIQLKHYDAALNEKHSLNSSLKHSD